MGQFLSQPVTEKKSEKGGDDFLKFGLSSMQGWRVSMEDSHSTILDLNKIQGYKSKLVLEANAASGDYNEQMDQEEKSDGDETSTEVDSRQVEEQVFDEQVAFFGVFDGHGGSKVALFTGEHLPSIVKDHSELIKEKNYAKALQDAFLACDRAILDDASMKNDSSGCAATTIIVTKEKLVCANSGDSRIVLSTDGYAKAMSYDHKPSNEGEKARIVAAGGYVDVGRVNGNLALSRCIGDFDFKRSSNLPPEEQIVTAFPDIIEHALDYDHDEFLILACDGIWDCLTSQQCVELVRKGINERLSLTEISEAIIDVCVAPNSMGTGIGCDNMSIAVVALLNGKSLDQWYDDIIAKGGPISKPFNEVRISIYDTDLGPNEEADDGQHQHIEDDNENGQISGIGKSFSQLISSSAATLQDGTYYINASNSNSLLASLGLLANDHREDNEEQYDDNNNSEDQSLESHEEQQEQKDAKIEQLDDTYAKPEKNEEKTKST